MHDASILAADACWALSLASQASATQAAAGSLPHALLYVVIHFMPQLPDAALLALMPMLVAIPHGMLLDKVVDVHGGGVEAAVLAVLSGMAEGWVERLTAATQSGGITDAVSMMHALCVREQQQQTL